MSHSYFTSQSVSAHLHQSLSFHVNVQNTHMNDDMFAVSVHLWLEKDSLSLMNDLILLESLFDKEDYLKKRIFHN